MTDPTEAEARAVWARFPREDVPPEFEAWSLNRGAGITRVQVLPVALVTAIRAHEREKVRALVEGLVAALDDGVCCDGKLFEARRIHGTEHTADCPWVEARLWLARGEVPE